MRINNNLMAMNTHRQLGLNSDAGAKSIEKLSSGYRINRAGDDAAGLSISEKMRGQIRGLDQASRNAQDGISMIQTAEGALNESQAILQRMRELSVQSSNGTLTSEDRDALQNEVTQLKSEIDRIGNTTEFNTQKLLNGSLEGAGGGAGLTSAAVFRGTKGSLTGADASGVDASGADFSQTDALVIDGEKIDIEWSKLLTDDEKDILETDYSGTMDAQQSAKIRDILEGAINEAIDNSGTGVSHVEVTDATAGTFKIESSIKGTDSRVELYIGDGATATAKLADGTDAAGSNSVLDLFAGAGAEMAAGAVTTTYGDWKTNIATTAGDTFTTVYAGQQFQVTMTGTASDSSLSTLATEFQTQINLEVTAWNTAAGLSDGDEGFLEDVIVRATSDGRLEFEAPSGELQLKEEANMTILDDQGLSEAAIEEAGAGSVTFQIGANKDQEINFSIGDMRSSALGIGGVDISSAESASAAITTLDAAISSVSSQRGKLGAVQNRLEHTIKNLDTSAENLQASESRIRDVDMAQEMMEFTKNNILQQAAQAMLAQANQAPQGVLQLLR